MRHTLGCGGFAGELVLGSAGRAATPKAGRPPLRSRPVERRPGGKAECRCGQAAREKGHLEKMAFSRRAAEP